MQKCFYQSQSHIRKGKAMKRNGIVYADECIRCEHATDDDGVLYCSEETCTKEGRNSVDQSGVQQAAAPEVVGRGPAS